jgi:hypothetical protein
MVELRERVDLKEAYKVDSFRKDTETQ